MANEDVLERFGWDGEEGLIFDRTKPFGDSTPEKGPLYEEVTTFDLIEIANDLAAALREAREDTRRLDALWDRLQGGPYFVVRLDSADALNRENVERFRGMGIIRLLDADAAMKPPGGEDGA